MLYVTCNEGTFECGWHALPMISDVVALDTYDQIFTFLTSVFMLCIMQANIRAFYFKLYGKISNRLNDLYLVFGILAMIGLHLVGVFDEHNYMPMH